jgi:hypothetical protein
MARELKGWLAAVLAAWGCIVIGYVPPRGVSPVATAHHGQTQPTAARLRAQALADEWRKADQAVRLTRYRIQLEPELARRREHDQAGPALIIEAPDSLPAYAREVVRSAVDTVWRDLGLDVSKVGVGVVLDFWRTRSTGTDQTPKVIIGSPSHLLPDSTDRTTCVALIPAWYWHWTGPLRNQRVEDRLREGLGPCAFLAAWGTPGPAVRRWLARRNYDLATFPGWDREWSVQSRWVSVRFAREANTPPTWYWPAVYGHPITAIGCLAGRATSCRAAVLSGAGDSFDDSVPRLLTNQGWYWLRQERLVVGDRYLADVAREVGHERFLRFWNSPQPVDTALAAALKMPVGEWTKRWERRIVPPLPLGPAAPLGAALLGSLLSAAAVALVARAAARRQVG